MSENGYLWRPKLNRARTKHAFFGASGWSICGAVGYSQTGPGVMDAKKCKRCEKIAKKGIV